MTAEELTLSAKLAAKKSKVRECVKGIVKEGQNKFQNYKFAQEKDVVVAVRAALIEIGLDFSMEAGSCEISHKIPTKTGEMEHFVLHLVCTLTDTETGFSERSPWIAGAADSGDKAIQKAFTSGEKYFLMKTFLIPTGDDLEAFIAVDEPPAKTKTAKKPEAQPTAQQKQVPQPATTASAPVTVLDKAWLAFMQAHLDEIPKGNAWSRDRFEAAIKGHFGRLPSNEASIPKILETIQPIEAWLAPDEQKAAA